MRPVVWMPFRGDGSWRDRNQALAYAQAVRLGYPVHVIDPPGEVFSISAAWNQAARESGDWTHAIRWAADFLLDDLDSVHEALESVTHYTLCSDKAVKLTRSETARMHRGKPGPKRTDKHPFGGVTVITRQAWDDVGGFDERFRGWGHEDRAFVHCIETLYGPRDRIPGRMLNLWHPKTAPYMARRDANHTLLGEYKQHTNPDDLREYLARCRTPA